MPRKEDGMLFEVHPSGLKSKDGKNYVYVRPLGGQIRSMKDFDDYCTKHYLMRPGEMTRALDVFVDAAKIWLADGNRIETPLGSFFPKIGLRRELTEDDEVRGEDVEFQSVDFTASKPFVESVRHWSRGFRRWKNPSTKELMANRQFLDNALEQSIADKKGYTDVTTFMMHSGLTYHSARKQLDSWCEEPRPRLMRSKLGSSYIYTMV